MSVEVKIVENLEVAGCSSDDARGGGVRKRDAAEGAFVGRLLTGLCGGQWVR